MIENSQGNADGGEDDEWRPESLRVTAPAWPPRPVKLLILAAVAIAHWIALALWLPGMASPRQVANDETALLVDFIRDPPPEMVQPQGPPPASEKTASAKPAVPMRKSRRITVDTPLQMLPSPPIPAREALELYGADGRLKVPDDMLEEIDKKFGDKRTFSYQIPRMDDAQKAFYRNPPIIYEKTRFDEYWKPDQDLLTGLLAKMVEKTTRQIRIPVPGRPDSKMVCTISLLALGGGCGVLTNGSDYVGPLDDPDTLNPQEDRQCKAWWEQIIGATTQEAWRQTRTLYEAECRKPVERIPAG